MANSDVEIEIKFPLQNANDVVGFLNKKAKAGLQNIYQKDTYYSPSHRNFIGYKYPYEWLRLRESAKGASLDYKHFHPENVRKTDYCDEFQTGISNAETLKKILLSLNFKEVIVVEKTRNIWYYKDAEIAIDDVSDLGSFIELELTKKPASSKEGKEYLYNILKELNAKVGEEDLSGYPYRILEKKGHKFDN